MQSLSNYQWHFFRELEQKILQFVWKNKRPQIAKATLREKHGTGETSFPDFRLYYSYSHQDSMVQAQKQKYRPMEQDRKPRDKPMYLWESYLWQWRQEYTMEERLSLQ